MLPRRSLLRTTTFTGIAWLLGCADEGPAPRHQGAGGDGGGGLGQGGGGGGGGGGPVGECADPFAGGVMIGTVPFAEDLKVPLGTKVGQGWDARLYYDLAELDPESLVTPTESFYIRTEYPDLLDENQPWAVRIHGLVESKASLSMADIEALAEPQGVHLLECSGNSAGGGFGLVSAADWAGAPMEAVLAKASALPAATRVLVSGFDEHSVPSANNHSKPGASWIFTPEELAGAFLATSMNGAPLTKDHGFPVRLLVPGWYGCCCIKWVNEIELVDEGEAATAQMKEFASRTHQSGTPALAKDYLPATLDQAAMPVRIEKWQVDGSVVYRLVGILWGGYELTDALAISFDGGASYEPVDVCPAQKTNRTWTPWSHAWHPPTPGSYLVRMGIDDPSIPTRRLDLGWYDREVVIDTV